METAKNRYTSQINQQARSTNVDMRGPRRVGYTREQRVNTQSGRKGCPEGACTLGLGCVCEPDLNDVDSLDAADEGEHQ